MLHSLDAFGTMLVVLWTLLAVAMVASPSRIFWLLGRRSPVRREVVITFRVLGFINVLGCLYLLFVRSS